MPAQLDPASRLQHREQHRQPVRVPADHGAARRRERRRRDQRLDLHKQRARALPHRRNTAAPGAFSPIALAKEKLRRVVTGRRPSAAHLERADLAGRAEAVLDRAQQAVMLGAVALEIQDRIDHVLDHLRAGDLAVLGDMANEEHGAAGALGMCNERLSGRAPG